MTTCHEYDAIEIVCMYQYPLKLTMKTGEVIKGKALDTQFNEAREECIKLDVGGVEVLQVLSVISTLEVCIKNPHFHLVSFSQ